MEVFFFKDKSLRHSSFFGFSRLFDKLVGIFSQCWLHPPVVLIRAHSFSSFQTGRPAGKGLYLGQKHLVQSHSFGIMYFFIVDASVSLIGIVGIFVQIYIRNRGVNMSHRPDFMTIDCTTAYIVAIGHEENRGANTNGQT